MKTIDSIVCLNLKSIKRRVCDRCLLILCIFSLSYFSPSLMSFYQFFNLFLQRVVYWSEDKYIDYLKCSLFSSNIETNSATKINQPKN